VTDAPPAPPLTCRHCGRPVGVCVAPNRLRLGDAILTARRLVLQCAHCLRLTKWRATGELPPQPPSGPFVRP
jgi:hypothetical protein